jgi:hypothetical protein
MNEMKRELEEAYWIRQSAQSRTHTHLFTYKLPSGTPGGQATVGEWTVCGASFILNPGVYHGYISIEFNNTGTTSVRLRAGDVKGPTIQFENPSGMVGDFISIDLAKQSVVVVEYLAEANNDDTDLGASRNIPSEDEIYCNLALVAPKLQK